MIDPIPSLPSSEGREEQKCATCGSPYRWMMIGLCGDTFHEPRLDGSTATAPTDDQPDYGTILRECNQLREQLTQLRGELDRVKAHPSQSVCVGCKWAKWDVVGQFGDCTAPIPISVTTSWRMAICRSERSEPCPVREEEPQP